ncbi:MAG: hypothetical protein H6922_03855 [Pseudomonadaceae bacterium]|nr:hypothetical protein [Pseudomonadaceae bacterium]
MRMLLLVLLLLLPPLAQAVPCVMTQPAAYHVSVAKPCAMAMPAASVAKQAMSVAECFKAPATVPPARALPVSAPYGVGAIPMPPVVGAAYRLTHAQPLRPPPLVSPRRMLADQQRWLI